MGQAAVMGALLWPLSTMPEETDLGCKAEMAVG